MSKVEHWALESPRPDDQSTLTFSYLYQNFPYRDFATRDTKQLVLSTPDARYAETPTHPCELTFPLPVTSIGISDFAGSRILMPKVSGLYFPRTPIRCATCPLPTPVAPLSFHRRNIAFRDSTLLEYLVLKTPDTPNPDFVRPYDTHPN
jgi:hypothetical protein